MTVIADQMPERVIREEPGFLRKVACFFGQHEWVARVSLGGEPDRARIKADPVGYFFIVFWQPIFN